MSNMERLAIYEDVGQFPGCGNPTIFCRFCRNWRHMNIWKMAQLDYKTLDHMAWVNTTPQKSWIVQTSEYTQLFNFNNFFLYMNSFLHFFKLCLT